METYNKVYDPHDPEYYTPDLVAYQRGRIEASSGYHKRVAEERKRIVVRKHRTVTISNNDIREILQKILLANISQSRVLMDAVIKTVCKIKGTQGKKRIEKKIRILVSGTSNASIEKIDRKDWIIWK